MATLSETELVTADRVSIAGLVSEPLGVSGGAEMLAQDTGDAGEEDDAAETCALATVVAVIVVDVDVAVMVAVVVVDAIVGIMILLLVAVVVVVVTVAVAVTVAAGELATLSLEPELAAVTSGALGA